MQISQRLLLILLCYCPSIFADVKLIEYIPPITAASTQWPETVDAIEIELRKQESLLAQLHAEMNAGFVSKKREEQLWEVQRIITQLKRSFKIAVKNQQDDKKLNEQKQVKVEMPEISHKHEINVTPIVESKRITPTMENDRNSNLMLPSTQAEYEDFVRMQMENRELKSWKADLQQRISKERAELLHLKQAYQYRTTHLLNPTTNNTKVIVGQHIANEVDDDYEHIIENFIRENTLLEYKRNTLAKQIFDEKRECIALQIQLQLQLQIRQQ